MARSGLLNLLENHSFSTDGKPLCLYGDPAYPLRIHLQSPFRAQQLTPAMAEFNRSMSAVRVSVEWLFGDVINYFKFLDFKKDLKIGLSAVGKMQPRSQGFSVRTRGETRKPWSGPVNFAF